MAGTPKRQRLDETVARMKRDQRYDRIRTFASASVGTHAVELIREFSNQELSDSDSTTVEWTTPVLDTDGFWSDSDPLFITLPFTGMYAHTVWFYATAPGSGHMRADIFDWDTAEQYLTIEGAGTFFSSFNISFAKMFEAGQKLAIEVSATLESGKAIIVDSGEHKPRWTTVLLG